MIEQLRDSSLVCKVIVDSVRLGMLKLTSGFLNEIKKSQKLDVALVDLLSSVNQGEGKDFRVDKDAILKFWNRVCVPDMSKHKKIILEESYRTNLSIHPRATKFTKPSRKCFGGQE